MHPFKGRTGLRPRFSERLRDAGIPLDPELLELEPFAASAAAGGGRR